MPETLSLLNLPNEVLAIIFSHVEEITSITRFGRVSKRIRDLLNSPTSDELVYKPAVLALNSCIDLRICKAVPLENGMPAPTTWKRAAQLYLKIAKNMDDGLENITCKGTLFDPVRSIRNQIPPAFGRPVEAFSTLMSDANIDDGLIYSISNWRDTRDGVVSSATICFDFNARKYRVIPVRSESDTMEYAMYNDPGLPETKRWDFSDMTQRRCLKRINDVIVMAGLAQPEHKYCIVARNHERELWRIPSPVDNLNILATSKYLVTVSDFPSYSLYDIRSGELITSGQAPFPAESSVCCAAETHFVVFTKFSLYCVSWDKLIDSKRLLSISDWTLLGKIDDPADEGIHSYQDLSFFGHSFGYRYISLELFGYAGNRAYIIDLYNGTLAKFLLPPLVASSPPGSTEISGACFNWTSQMERSLINEYGPRLVQTSMPDPRHAMFCWVIDQKGTVVFLSSLVLTQLGRIYCGRGASTDIRFVDYL